MIDQDFWERCAERLVAADLLPAARHHVPLGAERADRLALRVAGLLVLTSFASTRSRRSSIRVSAASTSASARSTSSTASCDTNDDAIDAVNSERKPIPMIISTAAMTRPARCAGTSRRSRRS